MVKISLCFTFSLVCVLNSIGQERKLKKALIEISEYDFEKSKKHINNFIHDENNSPLGYFVKCTYFTNDHNPTKNLDSAYFYLDKAILLKNNLPPKEYEEACSDLNFCIPSLENQKENLLVKIFDDYFRNIPITSENKEVIVESIQSIKSFLLKYSGTNIEQKATRILEEVEFNFARIQNTIEGFSSFITLHPNSRFVIDCKSYVCQLEFDNLKNVSSIEIYNRFIDKYPNEKIVLDVIYRRNSLAYNFTLKENTIEAYETFLLKYPGALNFNDAKEKILEIKFPTVKIGNQKWMKEDFKSNRFQNGDLISEAKTDEEWEFFNNNKQPCFRKISNTYLYNGFTIIDKRNICPEGFSIPELQDFRVLINFLGGGEAAVKKLVFYTWTKSVYVEEGMEEKTFVGSNESGFSANIGGGVDCNGNITEGPVNVWWTKTRESIKSQLNGCEGIDESQQGEIHFCNIYIGNEGGNLFGNEEDSEENMTFNLRYGFALRLLKK